MPERWYGCMFCKSGQEIRLAAASEKCWQGMRARAVCALKRRSRNGVRSLENEVMLPGYIFYEADDGCRPKPPLPEGIFRILTTLDGDCRLLGRDEWFAGWVLKNDGEIGISHAHRVGDRIQIRQGPLKDLEGSILRIDRRNKNGQVRLEIEGREIKVWLPFELVDDGALSAPGECEISSRTDTIGD